MYFREMKSVTIWFQNKRQTERKVALHHATSQSNIEGHAPFPDRGPASSHSSISVPSSHTSRPTHARTMSTSSLHTPRRKITPPRPRPSLDRVAARTESRLPPPRTPTKPRDPHASPWDNMPSSPLAPPMSPPAHDFIDFVGHGRTLEWACAAARLAEKEGHTKIPSSKTAYHDTECGDAGDETEEENVEAITPEGSFGSSHIMSRPWKLADMHPPTSLRKPGLPRELHASESERKDVGRDDDMMRAALVLCGLGRRL